MAYADFVTAMMALFMVLWISAQDEGVLEAVQDLEAPLRLHGLALRPHEDHHRHPGPGVLALVNGQGSEAGQGPP